MAISYQSVATQNLTSINGSPNTVTLGKPIGLAAGDLMLAIVGSNNGGDFATPSGWTKLGEQSVGGGDEILAAYWKIADSADAAASSFAFALGGTGGTNDYNGGALLRISGTAPVTSAAFYDGGADTDGGTTNNYTGGVTPLVADCLLVMGVYGRHASGAGVTVDSYSVTTSNPTWTERFEHSANDTDDYTIAVATAPRPEITATGDFAAVFSASQTHSSGVLIAIVETTNVTVSPSVISTVLNIQAPTVEAGASVSPSVITATVAVQAPTVTTEASDWSNKAKSSQGSTTNKQKS